MSDDLLPYYERELAYIRTLGAEFATRHPKIAGRLRLRPEGSQDPHVERMIEAFAYMNARIRHKLEDDYPEICESMLNVLYPHYLAPIPSMAIVKMRLDDTQTELTTGYKVATKSYLETDAIDGEPCRFRTCYPTTLWPISVQSAEYSAPPFRVPDTAISKTAPGLLRITLGCSSEKVTFADFEGLNSLRFYINAQPQFAYSIFEMLFNQPQGIIVARNERDESPVLLNANAIRFVGFEQDEGLLPYPSRSFLGYRLLTEYFSFPQKYLFFDLNLSLIPDRIRRELGNSLSIYVIPREHVPELQTVVTGDNFQLGCTPIINLFPQRAESIQMTHQQHEHRIVLDSRRPLAHEVYSVERVVGTSSSNEQVEFRPFYSFLHAEEQAAQQTFWHSSRRPAESFGRTQDNGSEVYLQLVDLDFSPAAAPDWILDVETICLNRDLPHRLPFGGGEPRLHLDMGGPLAPIECLTPPTSTHRTPLRHGSIWKLISHLSLNHLSLCDYEQGADGLREIAALYDYVASDETRAAIEGILNVSTRRATARVGSGLNSAVCRGVEINIDLDEDRFLRGGGFLFLSVMERFLAHYCSVNSFTKLVATSHQRKGTIKAWAPRAGDRVLI